MPNTPKNQLTRDQLIASIHEMRGIIHQEAPFDALTTPPCGMKFHETGGLCLYIMKLPGMDGPNRIAYAIYHNNKCRRVHGYAIEPEKVTDAQLTQLMTLWNDCVISDISPLRRKAPKEARHV